MPKPNEIISVEIKKKDVLRRLERALAGDRNSKLIAETIFECVAHDAYILGRVYHALVGIDTKLKWKVNQPVWVPITALPSWVVDRELTEELGCLRQGGLYGVIIEVLGYSTTPLNIRFKGVAYGGSEITVIETRLSESLVQECNDMPDEEYQEIWNN